MSTIIIIRGNSEGEVRGLDFQKVMGMVNRTRHSWGQIIWADNQSASLSIKLEGIKDSLIRSLRIIIPINCNALFNIQFSDSEPND